MKLFNRKMSKKQKAALNALADGIECGAKLRPQAFGNLAKEYSDGLKTCAMGAALECAWIKQGKQLDGEDAIKEFRSTEYVAILEAYGVDTRAFGHQFVLENELVAYENESIESVIWRLNDSFLWSREKIAQFLRELE